MTKKSEIREKLGTIDLSGHFDRLIKFRVPTGILAFDRVIGGGIPAGKLTEIYGDFSSGKSRIACHILAETQKLDGIAVLIDTERALDRGLVDLTGLDLENLLYPNPDEQLNSLEDVFRIIETAVLTIRDEYPDKLLTIVWDSVAATPGIEDLEKEIGRNEASMRRAKVISDGLKKVMNVVHKHKICLVFINQIRDRIGIMFGENITTVGGRALKFSASLRIHCKIIGKIRDDEKTKEVIGMRGQFLVGKSRVSKPFQLVNFEMFVDRPIDRFSGLLDYMVRHGEMEGNKGWYNFPGEEKKFRASEFAGFYEERMRNEQDGPSEKSDKEGR